MFPGTGPTFLGFYLFARWNPGTKAPDVIITGNGRIIIKDTAGPGGAKGDKKETRA